MFAFIVFSEACLLVFVLCLQMIVTIGDATGDDVRGDNRAMYWRAVIAASK